MPHCPWFSSSARSGRALLEEGGAMRDDPGGRAGTVGERRRRADLAPRFPQVSSNVTGSLCELCGHTPVPQVGQILRDSKPEGLRNRWEPHPSARGLLQRWVSSHMPAVPSHFHTRAVITHMKKKERSERKPCTVAVALLLRERRKDTQTCETRQRRRGIMRTLVHEGETTFLGTHIPQFGKRFFRILVNCSRLCLYYLYYRY
jgi:hypothetical protein